MQIAVQVKLIKHLVRRKATPYFCESLCAWQKQSRRRSHGSAVRTHFECRLRWLRRVTCNSLCELKYLTTFKIRTFEKKARKKNKRGGQKEAWMGGNRVLLLNYSLSHCLGCCLTYLLFEAFVISLFSWDKKTFQSQRIRVTCEQDLILNYIKCNIVCYWNGLMMIFTGHNGN